MFRWYLRSCSGLAGTGRLRLNVSVLNGAIKLILGFRYSGVCTGAGKLTHAICFGITVPRVAAEDVGRSRWSAGTKPSLPTAASATGEHTAALCISASSASVHETSHHIRVASTFLSRPEWRGCRLDCGRISSLSRSTARIRGSAKLSFPRFSGRTSQGARVTPSGKCSTSNQSQRVLRMKLMTSEFI